MANRSEPSSEDSRRILTSSSGRGLQVSLKRSGVSSIPNSSALGTANTNRTPPSSRGSAKINWLFHSTRPEAEEELADVDWKRGNGPAGNRRRLQFVHYNEIKQASKSIPRRDFNVNKVVSLLQGNLRAFSGRDSGGAATAGKDVHRGPCIVGSGRHCRYVDGGIHKSRVIKIVCGEGGSQRRSAQSQIL